MDYDRLCKPSQVFARLVSIRVEQFYEIIYKADQNNRSFSRKI